MKCKCGSEMSYHPQEQEYPGARVWSASWYCDICEESITVPIDTGKIREW